MATTNGADDRKMPRFTVFTPTYNRAHTITRVYESLLAQTMKDFEWLIIDDGSTDWTCNLVSRFVRCQSLFPIRYYRLYRNKGKHIAHNRMLREAQGELLVVADSDDWIVDNALERMYYHWGRLPSKADYSGVAGLCADTSGRVIGTRYSSAETHSTLADRKFLYGMKDEHWGFVRMDLARAHPFPEGISGFVPEGLVWLEIGKHYKDYCVNEVFRIYSR